MSLNLKSVTSAERDYNDGSLSLISLEIKHGKEGQNLSKVIVRRTLKFVLMFIVISLLSIPIREYHPQYINLFLKIISFCFSCPVIAFVFFPNFFIRKSKLPNLFANRTMWLLPLIVGQISIIFRNPPDPIKEFSTYLLLTVISYIATNILSELLAVREDYSNQKDIMDNLNRLIPQAEKDINNAQKSINNVNKLLVETQNKIFESAKILELRENLNLLEQAFENYKNSQFSDLRLKFMNISSEHIKLANKKLSNGQDEYIDYWIASSFQTALEQRRTKLDEFDTLVTDFSIYGGILRQCFTNFASLLKKTEEKGYGEIVIYTILVITPSEFLDYGKTMEDSTLSPSEKKQKITEWNHYLAANRAIAKNQNIDVHRHFLVHNMSNHNSPEFNQIQLGNRDLDDVLTSYCEWQDNEGRFKRPAITQKNISGNGKMILSLLDNEYHKPNQCKIMHLSRKFEQNTNLHSTLVYKVGNKKPIDYFCIGYKNQNRVEWKLCFRAIHDRDLGLAKITIFHDRVATLQQKEWKTLKTKLNNVFLIEEKEDEDGIKRKNGITIAPISKYKKI